MFNNESVIRGKRMILCVKDRQLDCSTKKLVKFLFREFMLLKNAVKLMHVSVNTHGKEMYFTDDKVNCLI